MALNRIVVLVGGVGGAKLAHGLAQILEPERLTIIVNTGDDFWHYGLRVCPDLDTVLYTLSGLVDPVNGWGIAGDTAHMLEALRRYGEEGWFRLGDRDLATHLLRTMWLRQGRTLTQVMDELRARLGVPQRLLPMTDAEVATVVDTVEHGELEFQTYFVRYRWQPVATAIRYRGLEGASVSEDVARAIGEADAILFGPSNPWLSIAPILSVPGMRELLLARDVPRVALSPIIEGNAVKGPAAKLMAELGYEPSAAAVARYYGDLINGYVFDERDAGLNIPVARATTFDTLMKTQADRARLAGQMLDWINSWGRNESLGDHPG
ncbi:MAG: 2-phospho-L-lactate transferase [Chloroflexota bacterium]|nr:MAG: 2-phospho-L-lactate transferase [Chloroflexota bacterium]